MVSGAEAVKALQRLGFQIDRQRGSHVVMKRVTLDGARGCVIPMHREVAVGTLRAALKRPPSALRNLRTPCKPICHDIEFADERCVEWRGKEVKRIEPSKISPMPQGLLNMMQKDEILDLVAYVHSGGNAKHAMFRK